MVIEKQSSSLEGFQPPWNHMGDNITHKDSSSYVSQVNERIIGLCYTLGLTHTIDM